MIRWVSQTKILSLLNTRHGKIPTDTPSASSRFWWKKIRVYWVWIWFGFGFSPFLKVEVGAGNEDIHTHPESILNPPYLYLRVPTHPSPILTRKPRWLCLSFSYFSKDGIERIWGYQTHPAYTEFAFCLDLRD
jgi:hypothetical protein